jgi:hypothetical protein
MAMAGEEDDGGEVIVSLPATEGEIQVRKVEPKAAGKEIESASFNEDPVEDLKSQFATMTQRATAAEHAAQQHARDLQDTRQQLQTVQSEVVTSQTETLESGIAAAEAEAAQAEAAYAAAFEAGDAMAVARAQRVMATAVSRKERLSEALEDLKEEVKAKPAQRQDPAQRPRQAQQDPVEAFASNMTPKSAAWIRAHPEAITDKKKNARMLAAHNDAVADDVEIESPEYFRRVEAAINKGAAKPAAGVDGDGRRPSSAAAGGGNPGGGGSLNGGGTEVRLTKGEARSATDGTLVWNWDDTSPEKKFKKGDPIGLAEMARRKHYGMKNGLYDKSLME